MKRLMLLLAIIVSCCSLVNAQEKFMSGGIQRTMVVYAPANLPANRPLLISLHGHSQDANYQSSQANYQAVADTAKFVVVYADGIDRSWDLYGDKDINFILDIIGEMKKRYNINTNRVYLSGFSMGGMMTYYAATKIADKIAAFAPVSGYNMGGPNAVSSRPIPLLHVHGTGDDVCAYSPVQSHIDAWVKRNGCNTTPQVLNPYPVGSNSTATMYRYRDGLNGVEVAHLKLPGKGHWHSNDPAFAMTNVEVWNFCQRYSLVGGPERQSLVPESGCFDMDKDKHNEFVMTFDKAVDCSKVKATLTYTTNVITLDLKETGESMKLTFTIPAGAVMPNGTYTLKVDNIESTDGGKGSAVTAEYKYGIEEVGETLNIDTILVQDWYSQKDLISEGIPVGWNRVNSRSDGSKDEKTSGMANTDGARMKYFAEGGDFKAGFYLSARDYDRVDFTYGDNSSYLMTLRKKRYIVSFNSIYWNTNARTDKNTFTMSIINRTNQEVLYSETLTPAGCLNEVSDIKVSGSKHHEIEVDIPTNARCLLQFSMTSGWNGIILSEPTITTCPSNADRYKGGFLRTLASAKTLEQRLKDKGHESAQLATLQQAIAQYDTFASISPKEYEDATSALAKAMEPLIPVGIQAPYDDMRSNANGAIYDLQGRRLNAITHHGIYIVDGKKVVK